MKNNFSCKDLKGIDPPEIICCGDPFIIRRNKLFSQMEIRYTKNGAMYPLMVYYNKGKEISKKQFHREVLKQIK